MSRRPMVFYPRRTLILWLVAATAFWIALLGYFFLRELARRQREMAQQIDRVRELGREADQIRAANRALRERVTRLQAEVGRLAAARRTAGPPPAPEVEERAFPIGRAVEVVPGLLFVTAARLEGARARVRIASLEPEGEANRVRSLSPGESWRFAFGGESYVLILHGIEADPPGARISIRKFAERPPGPGGR